MRIFFALTLLFSLHSSAQERKFTYYTTADGLPTNWIYACKEDSKGFLWIATESGLVRFDGKNFVTYNDKNGLPDVELLDLTIDKEDKVWMNLFRFNPSYFDPMLNRVFDSKKNSYLKNDFGGNIKIKVLQDGSVSYAGKEALVFNKNTSEFQLINTGGKEISALWKNGKGYIASYAYGFLQLAANSGGIIDSITTFPWQSGFTPLVQTHSDSTWFYNNFSDSLYLFTDINFINHTYNKKAVRPPEPLWQMNVDNQYVWAIAKSGSIYRLNKQTLETIDKMPLQVKNANRVYEDKLGNFWITTVDKGLIKVSSPATQSFFIPDGFTERNFLSICRIGNKIFAGNYKGEIVETDGKQFISHQAASGPSSWIRQLLPTSKGLLSISEAGIYTNFTNPVLNQFGKVRASSKNGYLLNDSILLVANHGVLTRTNLYNNIESKSIIKAKRITTVTVLKNQIYFGSNDGLYKWVKEDSALPMSIKNDLFASRITWLHNSKDDLVWAGTASEGLLIIYNDSLLAHISNEKYLASNAIRHIHSERPGTVWVATNKGISAIDYTFTNNKFQYNIRNIGIADGLLSPQVNALWVENDTVYAATANGINYFPANIKPPDNKLQVFITGFSVNGRDTSLLNSQSFPHHFKNILLHFAAPEINGSTVSYQYNINNAGWQNNSNGLLELPQLKPGHYSIDFRAIDANGKASPIVSSFKFIIHPAWWQTWWFIALTVAVIAGLLFYWLQKNNRNKREKAIEQVAAQQKLTDLELQAVKAQINPHFVFNCLNSIKSLIHQQQYEDADKYLDNFSYLLRSTIDHSSQKMIRLEDEIKYIDNYLRLEQLRFGKKLSYKIDIAVADTNKLQIPSMLLQPYVENAIKHGIRNLAGGDGFVSINVIQTGNTLTCRIDDNGVGRKAAAQINAANPNYHQSVGLSLTGKREELFGIHCHTIDKKDDMGKSMGTTVVLEIPLYYI
jgi:ligand-binding sensor domain-containing protein/two-component sensor histidine kinase